MSQKIIIPKGTIDSAHTTIIEIPNYLHETSTVVVTTPKTADSEQEEAWEAIDYPPENSPDQNEGNWEQDFDPQDMNDDTAYVNEQQEAYQYAPSPNDVELNVETQQRQQRPFVNYPEEQAVLRRPKYDQSAENMMRRMLDKKRELAKLRSERQRLLEGEAGTYEVPPMGADAQDNAVASQNLSEVPEIMRGRPAPQRDIEMEKERRRRQYEADRYQSRSLNRNAGYKPAYPQRDLSSPKYSADMQNQRYSQNTRPATQQWNPDIHGYPDMHSTRQGQPRQQYSPGYTRRQMPEQVMSPEDMRQYQKARRKASFNAPKN